MAKQALKGSRLNLFAMDPDDLVIVGLDTDDTSTHPLFDERIFLPMKEGMILSMLAVGVQHAVTVVKDGDKALVVDGRQRVRHAREAKKRQLAEGSETLKVPCKVVRGDDGHIVGLAALGNSMREEESPLAKAKRAQRMVDMGKPLDYIALYFGVTTNAVRSWLTLLETAAPVQAAVERGQLPASAAVKLAKLSKAEQAETLKEMVAKAPAGKVRGHAVEKHLKGDGPRPLTRAEAKKLLKEYSFDLDPLDRHACVVDVLKFFLGEDSGRELNSRLAAALKEIREEKDK